MMAILAFNEVTNTFIEVAVFVMIEINTVKICFYLTDNDIS